MVEIEPRSAWGPSYANGDRSLPDLAVGVYVHHSVTTQLPATATVAQERTEMKTIERIGQDKFGSGISYNVVVFPSGRAYEGVSMNRRGTHTGGLNSTVRSICFAGNYETNRPTPKQLATAAAIFQAGKGKWWTPAAYVKGHRDLKATACPGRHVYSQLNVIKGGRSDPTPTPGTPAPAPLTIDGYLGRATIRRWQQVMGTTVDGVISKPSQLIAAAQKAMGIKVDGYLGQQTIRALQTRMGTTVDGVISKPSQMVKALQRRLNAGRF